MSKFFDGARIPAWALLLITIASGAVHAQSSGCVSVTAGAGWINNFFAPQSDWFTIMFSATPSAAGAQMDTVMGLSNSAQTNPNDFTAFAVLVRFNAAGKIDARNGGVYPSSSFSYTAGVSYGFRVDVNTKRHTYSVYVRPPGRVETPIALNYAFRTEQSTLSTLSNFSAISDLGASSTICDFMLVPGQTGSGCTVATAGSNWTNMPFTSQTEGFTVVFDAAPGGSGPQMDTVMALSNSPQNATDFTGSAVTVRFNSSGTIDARNGSIYPMSSYSYSAGVSYRFRLVVNVPQHSYSVYVTRSGKTETAIAVTMRFAQSSRLFRL